MKDKYIETKQIPKGFKQTDIGLIPENWEVESLKSLQSEKIPSINPAIYENEEFEYYSIPAYQDSGIPYIELGKNIQSNKLLLKEGSVLFGKLNPRVEKVWRVKSHTQLRKIGSTEWIPILPNDNIDTDFLYYLEWSKYVMPIAKTLVSGSTPSRQRVDPKSFYKIKIPLPPLPEQIKIAHVLSKIQQAIETQEQIIKTTQELKKALMQKLFTEGLNGEPQKQTEIGLIPESWDVKEFIDYVMLQRGKDLPKYEFEVGNVPVAGSNGVIGFHSKAFVKAPGLTVGRSGSCGIVTFYTIDFWAHNTVLYAKEFKGNYPKFVYYHLQSVDLSRFKSGVSVPTLNRNSFSGIKIAIPSVKEQESISKILSNIDDKLDLIERKKMQLNELFKSILSKLMTGQIRVKDIEFELEKTAKAVEGV